MSEADKAYQQGYDRGIAFVGKTTLATILGKLDKLIEKYKELAENDMDGGAYFNVCLSDLK